MGVEVIVRSEDFLGEGVVWCPQTERVLWTDITGRRFHSLDPASGNHTTTALSERLCSFAVMGHGRILAAFASGLQVLDLSTMAVVPVASIGKDMPTTRLNDGRPDRQGRFLFGSMDEQPSGATPIGRVYSCDRLGNPRELFSGVRITNSICFSPDGKRMYFADTPSRLIEVFHYEPDTGVVSGRRPFAEVPAPAGFPDGSTVDADGCLWNAEWGGSRVVRYTPDGRIDRTIAIPSRNVTCCTFGGRDLRTLYLTSARNTLTAPHLTDEPLAGSLFAIDAGVAGLPDAPLRQ